MRNLQSAQQKWERLARVMEREGAYERTLGSIHVDVVHVVLMYGSETWVMTPHSGRVLGGFHHRVACRLTGQKPQRGINGKCVYPLMVDAME